jgi:hypothetical protein
VTFFGPAAPVVVDAVQGRYSANSTTLIGTGPSYGFQGLQVDFTGPVARIGSLSLQSAAADFSTGSATPMALPSLTMALNSSLGGSDSLVVAGLFHWQDSTLAGPAGSSLTAQGGILVDAPGSHLDGRTVNNVATATITGAAGGLGGGDGAVWNNLTGSTLDLQGDSSMGGCCIGDWAVTVNNAGTITKSSGSGTSLFYGTLNNAGSVIVQQGTLALGNATNSRTVTVASGAALGTGNYSQTGGATVLNGATLAGGPIIISGGVLAGTGTINANVTSGGQVIPGGTGAAGVLTISGSYTQTATGSLNIELGGSTAGNQYDQLVVSGAASLGGALNIATIGSFTPALSNTFQVLTFGSSSGNFATYNGPSLASGMFLDPVFNATSLTLDIDRVAISGAPASPVTGIPINLNGSVTGPSVGNPSVFSYAWTITQNSNPYQSGSGSAFSFTPNLSATYLTTLTVTDTSGGRGTTILQVVVPPSIAVLNPTANAALSISGGASVNIPGGVIVDSSAAGALSITGTSQLTASVIDVLGGVKTGASSSISPAPTTGISVADPLAALAGPNPTGITNYGSISLNKGSLTINPGTYSQIKVSNSASLTMNPGIYIIEGGGLTVTGSASISGSGVMIYNAGSNYPSSGGKFGGITISSSGTISLSAPTSGPYAGVLIFQSHQNTLALSLSGNALTGMNGTIYAPSALLSLTGSAQLQQGLVVGTLSVSGPIALTQIAAGSDGTGDNSGIANTLLAGDLAVYINDPSGLFSPDELSRIQDAINAWDAILAPYNVTITEVTDRSLANLVIDTNTTSACGGMTNGVLGCYNEPNSEITMIQGWSWYAGSDPAQIGAGQYDFESTVLHELGHALGLGGSTNPNSPMYETLAAGVAVRTVTTQDLNIPDPPAGADPQMAARFDPGPAPALSSAPNPVPAGLVTLPPAGPAVASSPPSLLSAQPAAPTQAVATSQAGPGPSFVSQRADQEDGRGLTLAGPRAGLVLDLALGDLAGAAGRWRGEGGAGATGVSGLAPDLADRLSQPPDRSMARAASSGQTAAAHPAVLQRTVPQWEGSRTLTDPCTGPAFDAALEDLAADAAESPSQPAAGRDALAAPPPAGISNPPAPGNPISQPDPSGHRGGALARLAVALMAAGLWGHGAGLWDPRSRRPGRLGHVGRSR